MKFLFDEVNDCSSMIESDLKHILGSLIDIRNGLDTITSTLNWTSDTREYFTRELRDILSNMDDFESLSSNINSYLDGVIQNYERLENGSLFDNLVSSTTSLASKMR